MLDPFVQVGGQCVRNGFLGAQEGNPVCFDPGGDAPACVGRGGEGGEGVWAEEDCGCVGTGVGGGGWRGGWREG